MYGIKSFLKSLLVCSLLFFSIQSSCKVMAAPQQEAFSPKFAKTYAEKNVYLPSLPNYKQSKNLVARDYTLGPNDIISMEVLGVPDLTKEVRIRPDGKISIPFVEDLNVAGMTISELQSKIKQIYNDYLQDPKLNIRLIQGRPFIVYVSGAVVNPGSYEMNTMTNQFTYIAKPEAYIERKTPLLSNIVIAAGGVNYDADLEHVQIKNDFDNTSYEVNLFELIKNANSSQDMYLTAGDRVYIPSLSSPNLIDPEKYKVLVTSTIFQKSIPVKVLGYVNTPGLVNLSSQQSTNLSSAVAAAGGYLKDSAYFPKKILISRADNNNKLVTVSVDPREKEFTLMPNDIVYVPEKTRPMVGKAFDYVGRIMYPFYAFANTYNNLYDIFN